MSGETRRLGVRIPPPPFDADTCVYPDTRTTGEARGRGGAECRTHRRQGREADLGPVAQSGRAPASHAGGTGFKSRRVHSNISVHARVLRLWPRRSYGRFLRPKNLEGPWRSLDSASGCGPEGPGFESPRAHLFSPKFFTACSCASELSWQPGDSISGDRKHIMHNPLNATKSIIPPDYPQQHTKAVMRKCPKIANNLFLKKQLDTCRGGYSYS